MHLTREPDVASIGVHDHASRAAMNPTQVREMEAVMRAQSHIGDQNIKRPTAASVARCLKGAVRFDACKCHDGVLYGSP
jgi:hypothetical protein